MFPDMPWMVSNDAVTARIRDAVHSAWPARTTRYDRLYAFGFDAYRLVPALRANGMHDAEISGVTGKLRLDDHNRVRRDLDWAVIRDGLPAEL
jgi:outer membrane PBP1 activator LpoA protein